MKKCSKCKVNKSKKEFSKKSSNKDGLKYWCIDCSKESIKKWRKNNKERIKIYTAKYVSDNKEIIKQRKKEYRLKNKEKIKIYNREYKEKNKIYLKK